MAYNASNETKEMLAEIWKSNNGNSIKVQKVTNNTSGSVSADIRRYYTSDEGEELPTQKGIRVNTEIIPDLIKVLAGMLEYNEVEDVKDELDNILDAMETEGEADSDTPEA